MKSENLCFNIVWKELCCGRPCGTACSEQTLRSRKLDEYNSHFDADFVLSRESYDSKLLKWCSKPLDSEMLAHRPSHNQALRDPVSVSVIPFQIYVQILQPERN
jgi:hypothetical protein